MWCRVFSPGYTCQMIISRPRSNRRTELLILNVLESRIANPPLELRAWMRIFARIRTGANPRIHPGGQIGILGVCPIFGIIPSIKFLELNPSAWYDVLVTTTHQLGPILNGANHVSNVDIIKFLLKAPRLLAIIDYEFDFGWNPGSLNLFSSPYLLGAIAFSCSV